MVKVIYFCSDLNIIWSYMIYVKLLSTMSGTFSTSYLETLDNPTVLFLVYVCLHTHTHVYRVRK